MTLLILYQMLIITMLEKGGMLSLGQRQLISFVRAYVNQPKILVLDEATSSIDSESEYLIQRSSEKLTKDRTSIVIAHRLATVQNADKLILLENGKLIEEGSHQELLSKNGKYKFLYDLQFKKVVQISLLKFFLNIEFCQILLVNCGSLFQVHYEDFYNLKIF